MGWLKSTLTDDRGMWDVAYVSLFALMAAVFSSIVVMCAVSTAAYLRCAACGATPCVYDPQPLGIAVGAVCGGFATALGALAGYMMATRSKPTDRG